MFFNYRSFSAFLISSLMVLSIAPKVYAEFSVYDMDLGKVVVTSSKLVQAFRNTSQNVTVINSKEINASGANEISEILNYLPSVDINGYGSAGAVRGIQIRGASSQQVVTMIDGREINTPRDGLSDFNRIPIANIERIEILRGPASAIYGANAVGGVINIITKSGSEKMFTELVSEYGAFATNHESLAHGYKIGGLDYFITYEYLNTQGHRENSAHHSNNAVVKVGYDLNDSNRINVSGGYYDSKTGTPGLITFENLQAKQLNSNKFADMTYTGKLAEGQDLYLKLFSSSDRLEYVRTFEPNDRDTHQIDIYGVDAQISQKFMDVFRTAVGASFQEQFLDSTNSGEHTTIAKGFYTEAEMDIFKKGALKFGARWDDYSTFGDMISPSASVYFWPTESLKVHALAGRSFRAPTFNDLYWPREDYGVWGGVEGNPNIGPEKAISYEAGFSTYFFKKVKTDITFFRNEYDDLIEWSMDNLLWWRPNNVSSATVNGVEAEMEYAFRDNLRSKLNYTYLDTENETNNKELIYRPQNLCKLILIYNPSDKWELSATGSYKGARFADTANDIKLKAYTLVNLHAGYNINDNAQVFMDVKNAFDRDYQDQLNYSVPGRAFYGGLKITF